MSKILSIIVLMGILGMCTTKFLFDSKEGLPVSDVCLNSTKGIGETCFKTAMKHRNLTSDDLVKRSNYCCIQWESVDCILMKLPKVKWP